MIGIIELNFERPVKEGVSEGGTSVRQGITEGIKVWTSQARLELT